MKSTHFILVADLCMLATSVIASAAPPRDKVRVTYVAPADCPSQLRFEERVSVRVSVEWLASSAELARPLKLTVERDAQYWQARLDLQDTAGDVLTRSVSAASCEAAVEAIALVTALLLDPPAQISNAGGAAESAPARSERQNHAPLGKAAERADYSRMSWFVRSGAEQSAIRPLPTQSVVRPELGASFGIASGLGPSIAYGPSLFIGFSVASKLSRLGIGSYESESTPTRVDGVGLRVHLLAAKLEHCPVALQVLPGLATLACIRLESGILLSDAQSDARVNVQTKSGRDLWFMAGLVPKLRYEWQACFAELEPGLFAPVTRRRFEIAGANGPSEVAYRTPVLVVGVLSSLGLQFE